MRELRFRALKDDMSNCNFVYGYLVKDEEGNSYITEYTSDKGYTHSSCLKGTEGQFTGLKDKNGKEIYEGDILKICDGSINLQPWFRPNHVVKYEVNGFNIPKWMYNNTDSTHWCELIGNIYQNKDLIKTL